MLLKLFSSEMGKPPVVPIHIPVLSCRSVFASHKCSVIIAAWKANIDTKSDSLISGYTQLHISEDKFTYFQWSASHFYATWTQCDELRWILRGTEKQVPRSRPAQLCQNLGNKRCVCCNANVHWAPREFQEQWMSQTNRYNSTESLFSY